MPKFTVEKSSHLSAPEAYERVSGFLENDKELKKLDPGYKCEFNESQKSGKATGKFFKADMNVAESDKGSLVKITVDLPFTLALAKGLIEKTLNKKLDESLS